MTEPELTGRRRELLSEWDALTDAHWDGRISTGEFRVQLIRLRADLEDVTRRLQALGWF